MCEVEGKANKTSRTMFSANREPGPDLGADTRHNCILSFSMGQTVGSVSANNQEEVVVVSFGGYGGRPCDDDGGY